MAARCELVILIPNSIGYRFSEDGYFKALNDACITACIDKFEINLASTLKRRAEEYKEDGVKAVVYPSFNCDIFAWGAAELACLPKEEGVFERFEKFQCGGIRLFLKFLEEAGVRTLAVDMHYDSPFDDFEATFYSTPEGFVKDLLERAPELEP